MARKPARRYGGRCDLRALWHNDTSKATDHWVRLGQNVGCRRRRLQAAVSFDSAPTTMAPSARSVVGR